ncbi:MAG: S8 family serine peptidase [Chitinophagales bacterium]
MISKIKYFCVLLLLFSVVHAQNANRKNGEIIIQLFYGVQVENVIDEIENSFLYSVSIKKNLSDRLNIWLIGFDEDIYDAEKVLSAFFISPSVANVQFNHFTQARSIPDDMFFTSQWNMVNDGAGGGLTDADIDAEQAWNVTTGGVTIFGDTIVVAIVGEGGDLPHEDLDYWENHNEIPLNLIDDDSNGYIDDYYGWNATDGNGIIPERFHGTHVAGIIGAIGNNNIGVAGVNWHVKIMPVYTLSEESEAVAAYAYVFSMRELYDQTDGEKGAFIVATNSSFGIDFANPEDYPLWCAMYDSLGTLGILSAAATANIFANIDIVLDMPTACSSPHLITVTNTTKTDNLSIAGYGKTTIDLGAPGDLVYSTALDNTYGYQSGTSMASPHVAGAVALLFSAACEKFMEDYVYDPSAMALLLKEYILNGVDPLADLDTKSVTGGRLNLGKAINNLVETGYCFLNVPDPGNDNYDFVIYPNPVSDKLFFVHDMHFSNEFSLRIYNELAQIVFDKSFEVSSEINNGISIQNLPEGIYFLTLTETYSGISRSSEFIIQH